MVLKGNIITTNSGIESQTIVVVLRSNTVLVAALKGNLISVYHLQV